MTKRRASDGFGLIEMMVGTVLVSLSSLALVGIVMHLSAQSRKAQMQNLALAVQTQVVTGLSRADTFAGSEQFSTMKSISGDPNAGLTEVAGIVLNNSQGQAIAVSGQRIGLDRQYNGCNPTAADCPLRVDLAVRCSGAVGCQAAYRVSISPALNPVSAAALGAPLR